jgi:murein DD-endopeptidase MepM/ murein hydrolase activator NlpD
MKRVGFLKAFGAFIAVVSLVACGFPVTREPVVLISPRPTLMQTSAATPVPSVTPQMATPVTPEDHRLATETITPTSLPVFHPCSPLNGTPLQELPEIISDPYHPPPMGKDDRHQGVDFSYYRRGERTSIEGVTIQSVLPGRVAASIHESFPFGNFVIIETSEAGLPAEVRQRFAISAGESLYILYAHMQALPQVLLGDQVQACQALGEVGKSGNAGVAHLHLEMRHGPAGAQFPVMAYYLASNTLTERANYLKWATSGAFLHFDPMDLLSFEDKN